MQVSKTSSSTPKSLDWSDKREHFDSSEVNIAACVLPLQAVAWDILLRMTKNDDHRVLVNGFFLIFDKQRDNTLLVFYKTNERRSSIPGCLNR